MMKRRQIKYVPETLSSQWDKWRRVFRRQQCHHPRRCHFSQNTCVLIWRIHIKQQPELQYKNDSLQRVRLQHSLIASCQSPERVPGVQFGVSRETGDRGYIAKKEKTKSIGRKCSKRGMFLQPINMPLKNLHYATAAQQLPAFHD